MSWRVSLGFAVTISSSALIQSAAPVRADEAYLCGPDTVVYVAVADLEAKKHSDPCIAAYYGLTVDKTAQPDAAGVEVRAPATPASAIGALEFKPLDDSDIPVKAVRQAFLEPPRAMPGTDYRNVHVLNASSPGSEWFHHAK